MAERPQRRHMRLRDYDYSQAGAYFVTICTYDRLPVLGSIHRGEVQLSPAGRIVEEEWLRTPRMRRSVVLDEYVIMPNHVHGILFLAREPETPSPSPSSSTGPEGKGPWLPQAPSRTLGAIMRGFKAATTSRVRKERGDSVRLWQAQYFDHVVRDDDELQRIREYIVNNPPQWELDRYFRDDGGPARPRITAS